MLTFIFFVLSVEPAFAVEKCSKNEYWVRPYNRRAYYRGNGTFVSATSVKGHCREKTQIVLTWENNFAETKPNLWPDENEKFKSWTLEEKERVLEALEMLPAELWKRKIPKIARSIKSKDFPNPASSMDGYVVLYDSAFLEKNNLARILAHELSHQAYVSLLDSDRVDYWYSTNWLPINNDKDRFFSRKDGYVQDDGRDSPAEDFANNVEYFLFEPQILNSKTPHAYRWIQNYFGDKFSTKKEQKK